MSWVLCSDGKGRSHAPYFCFLWWESSYWSSDIQGHGILFPSTADTWKTLKIQMSKRTYFAVEKNSPWKVIERTLCLWRIILINICREVRPPVGFCIYFTFFLQPAKQSWSLCVKSLAKGRQQNSVKIFYWNLPWFPAATLCWVLEVISKWTQSHFLCAWVFLHGKPVGSSTSPSRSPHIWESSGHLTWTLSLCPMRMS